jgi:hypothetical protein
MLRSIDFALDIFACKESTIYRSIKFIPSEVEGLALTKVRFLSRVQLAPTPGAVSVASTTRSHAGSVASATGACHYDGPRFLTTDYMDFRGTRKMITRITTIGYLSNAVVNPCNQSRVVYPAIRGIRGEGPGPLW